MRIWSIHPKYLDSKGLVALWRETLLAKNVLEGKTKGYKNHPQLLRFKATKNPVVFINFYLKEVLIEAEKRNYQFDKSKIGETKKIKKIKVSNRQIKFEFEHLLNKLKIRNIDCYKKFKTVKRIEIHPLFEMYKGEIEEWEKGNEVNLKKVVTQISLINAEKN